MNKLSHLFIPRAIKSRQLISRETRGFVNSYLVMATNSYLKHISTPVPKNQWEYIYIYIYTCILSDERAKKKM